MKIQKVHEDLIKWHLEDKALTHVGVGGLPAITCRGGGLAYVLLEGELLLNPDLIQTSSVDFTLSDHEDVLAPGELVRGFSLNSKKITLQKFTFGEDVQLLHGSAEIQIDVKNLRSFKNPILKKDPHRRVSPVFIYEGSDLRGAVMPIVTSNK